MAIVVVFMTTCLLKCVFRLQNNFPGHTHYYPGIQVYTAFPMDPLNNIAGGNTGTVNMMEPEIEPAGRSVIVFREYTCNVCTSIL